jgi:hypothetical protein
MLPDRNNVYGEIRAARGLKPVLETIAELVGDRGRASVRRSGYDGSETLEFENESVDFESTPAGVRAEHLLTGGVGGTIEDVLAFVGALSAALSEVGVAHRLEVYDDQHKLVRVLSGSGWPL